ncbi:hypothetical protein I6F15_14300 [Bradyrhizobium sp. BRP14]|nr:hypothetical protein [Bradyrhizobium sp. BRP14]
MRIFMTFVAVVALAAAPCAWDRDPREPPAIAALFAGPMVPADTYSAQVAPALDIPGPLP